MFDYFENPHTRRVEKSICLVNGIFFLKQDVEMKQYMAEAFCIFILEPDASPRAKASCYAYSGSTYENVVRYSNEIFY